MSGNPPDHSPELGAADRAQPVFVAVDTTHAEINRTGLGRYAAELRPALEARPGLRVLPIRAMRHVASSHAGRIAQGLRREGLYYPERLARSASRAGAEVLHLPTPAAIRAGGLPLVVTVHDLLPLRHPELFTRETRWHTRLFVPFVRRANRLIVPSQYTREEAIALLDVPPEHVIVVPMARGQRFHPGGPDRDALAFEIGIAGRYVLAVGTLEPRKNLVTVLRAFARIASAVDDIELVITGGRGWRNEAFEVELERLDLAGRVRLTGFVSEERLVDLYAGAACFLFPSLAEGFGLPVIEAMACGAPVITGNRTSLPEVAGEAALLVEPLDAEALAAATLRVLEDEELAAKLRDAGLQRASSFTWEATAAGTERVYREALGQAKSFPAMRSS